MLKGEEMLPAGLGHNQPPEVPLADRLKEEHAEALAMVDAIAAKATAAPTEIETEDQKAALTDIAAEAAKHRKVVDGTRIAVKAPFKKAVDDIDGFFRGPIDRLERIDKALMQRVTAFDRAKVAREREAARRKEEEARKAEEAARQEAQQAATAGRLDDAMAALEDAADAGAAARSVATAAPNTADSTRVTTAGGVVASAQTEWTFEVTDRTAVDLNALRDFIAPDDVDAALKRFVKINKGTRQIAGVRIFEDVITRRRRGG